MTSLRSPAAAHLSVRGPADLVQTIPYLLGFRPEQSLVLVGLRDGQVAVTARLDLSGAVVDGTARDALGAMRDGGASGVVAAVFADGSEPGQSDTLPWLDVVDEVTAAAALAGCSVTDALLVADGRYWSYLCADPACCPREGRALPADTTAVVAAATYAGMVALPDRASLAALLDPCPDADRAELCPALAAAEDVHVRAVHEGSGQRHDRSVKRAIFAAARAGDEPGADVALIAVAHAARFGAALSRYPIRDAVWMAVDDGRIDGRELWRALAARLPSPYDAAPLFLFGWSSWRAGNGALAGLAAERAVASDPAYSAADLLLAALSRGIDPRRLPRLRATRPG